VVQWRANLRFKDHIGLLAIQPRNAVASPRILHSILCDVWRENSYYT